MFFIVEKSVAFGEILEFLLVGVYGTGFECGVWWLGLK